MVVPETISLFTPIGCGECTAYVGLYSPAGRADRIVLLSTDRPCDVGTRFEVDGATWVVKCALTEDAEGMWAAFPVKQ